MVFLSTVGAGPALARGGKKHASAAGLVIDDSGLCYAWL
jgi:hypothetical protein